MNKVTLVLIVILATIITAQGQTNNTQLDAGQVQPKIMVIPRVPSDQNIKTFYDTCVNMQVAIAKINEALLKEGANLVSFDQVLKQITQNDGLSRSSGNQEDYKSSVLRGSGADIYVEAKLDVVRHAGRGANSVTVILEGYQTGTSNLLGSRTGTSPMNRTEDIGLLTMLAMETVSAAFINNMRLKFYDIYENGQSIYVEFSLSEKSDHTFDSETGPQRKLLSEIIDEWFQANAYKSVFNSQGVTSNKMILSDVRIPLKNPTNPKANYTGQNFYIEILKLFRSLNIPIKREMVTNNKIIITIL